MITALLKISRSRIKTVGLEELIYLARLITCLRAIAVLEVIAIKFLPAGKRHMGNVTLKILLVEDNLSDADLLQEMLSGVKNLTLEITHVAYLKTALDYLIRHPFDIVLSDLSLPDAAGLEAVIQIHALVPNLPIVILTGWDDEEIGLETLRQGAQDYLAKGQIQPELLARTIRYAVERSQTQRVIYQQAAAMAASMEGIAILNQNREHSYVNQAFAKLHGYHSPSELIGKAWQVLYEPAEFLALEHKIRRSMREQGYWHGEAVACRFPGEVFYQELSITALDDGGFICNVQDITERKQAEIEILNALQRERELNELKSRFVAMVSHEFRTPLASILSAAEILQKYGHQGTEQKNQTRYGRIISGARRMTKLLDDMLLFNKAEAGKLQFNPVLTDVTELCRSAIEEIQPLISVDHEIGFLSQMDGCSYCLDQYLLRQILTNLITNAVKYSPHGGEVTVACSCQSQQIVLQVSDQGIGIPDADLDRLFTVFHRGRNVGTISGTGLGLALVKQCVDLHGGTIEVSTEISQGTTFTVRLPIAEGPEAEGPELVSKTSATGGPTFGEP